MTLLQLKSVCVSADILDVGEQSNLCRNVFGKVKTPDETDMPLYQLL